MDAPLSERRPALWLPAVAAVVAHLAALSNGYTLDDFALLVENPYLRSWSALPALVSREMFLASGAPALMPYWRPASSLLYFASYLALGTSAALQHALNILLYAGVSVLVARVLCAGGVSRRAAVLAAVLFAVHPASAEVVAYIGGRQDLLGWLFALAALAPIAKGGSFARTAGVAFAGTLMAVLSREFFMAMPLVYAVAAPARQEATGVRRRVPSLVAAAAGAVAVGAMFAARHALGLVALVPARGGFAATIRAAAAVGARLLRDVALPTDLAFNVTPFVPSLPLALGGFAVALALGAGLVRSVSRRNASAAPIAAAGVAIAFAAAVLHAEVELRFGYIADRYAIVMLVGCVLALAPWLDALAPVVARSVRSPALRRVLLWTPVALAVALLPFTASRDLAWRSDRTLLAALVADRPGDPEAEFAAGDLAFRAGHLDEAYGHCKRYAEAHPRSTKAALCLGAWLLIHGQPARAAEVVGPYVKSSPGEEAARRQYLAALFATGRLEQIQHWLDVWSPMFPGASDLAEARAELSRRRGSRAPGRSGAAP